MEKQSVEKKARKSSRKLSSLGQIKCKVRTMKMAQMTINHFSVCCGIPAGITLSEPPLK